MTTIRQVHTIVTAFLKNRYYNLATGNLNKESSLNQTLLYTEQNALLDPITRIFGSKKHVKRAVKDLDAFLKVLSNYAIDDVYALLYRKASKELTVEKFLTSLEKKYQPSPAFKRYAPALLLILAKMSDRSYDPKNNFEDLMKRSSSLTGKLYRKIVNPEEIKRVFSEFVIVTESPLYTYKVKRYDDLQAELEEQLQMVKNTKSKLQKVQNKVSEMRRINVRKRHKKHRKEEKLILQASDSIDEADFEDFLTIHSITSNAKKKRFRLWYTYFGENEKGNCYSCMNRIRLNDMGWHCGHILSAYDGGEKELGNLHPICAPCNNEMREQHMYRYMIYKELPGCRNLNAAIIKRYEPELNMYRKVNAEVDALAGNRKVWLKVVQEWFSKRSRIWDLNTLRLAYKLLSEIEEIKLRESKQQAILDLIDSLYSRKRITLAVSTWIRERSCDLRIRNFVKGLHVLKVG